MDIVVDVDVVDIDETFVDELQEFAVVVDKDNDKLASRCVGSAAGTYFAGQCAAGVLEHLHLALRVQLEAVVDALLGLSLRILQSQLHVGDAGDNL